MSLNLHVSGIDGANKGKTTSDNLQIFLLENENNRDLIKGSFNYVTTSPAHQESIHFSCTHLSMFLFIFIYFLHVFSKYHLPHKRFSICFQKHIWLVRNIYCPSLTFSLAVIHLNVNSLNAIELIRLHHKHINVISYFVLLMCSQYSHKLPLDHAATTVSSDLQSESAVVLSA